MSDIPPIDPPNNAIADGLLDQPAPDAETSKVLVEATPGGAVTVTINRPERKNAFDAETIAALHEAFETLQGQDGVRVVFVRGAGDTFSAGADLDWMRSAAEWDEADNRDDAMMLARMLKALHDIPCLTVALVDGAAFGGGVGLVAACDTAVATHGARFSFSEVKLGLTPATISPYVVEAIGARNARALFAMGLPFDAQDALNISLVHRLVADGAGLDRARDWIAGEVRNTAPGAVAAAKDLVRHVEGRAIDHALMADTAERIAARRVSDEGREGVRAFLERRRPGWVG
ncbi:MAG: enoyl-CoA hydratase/isomerase family protein [Caulobacteraceae bacterium]|nr:enoyl-CoA hydratase/isomerase family protein [Caulobacteraceae bacterium]